MSYERKLSGIGIAMAAAALIATAGAPVTVAHADGMVKCAGINSCKGTSACQTASNPGGPGQNSCKGHGMTMTQTQDECTSQGGEVLT